MTSPSTAPNPKEVTATMSTSVDGTVPRALPAPARWRGLLTAIRANRLVGAAVTFGLGVAAAGFTSVPMPRGPVTATEGVLVVASSLVVGLVAGFVMRSRWAMVLAPLGYAVGYELARLGITGAAFGPIRLDTPYGIVALVAGRGVQGLLAFVPMLAGASLGLALAHPAPRRPRSFVPGGVLLTATAGLAVLVAVPGSTPPVTTAEGTPVPGGIAELTTVTLGGHEQAISIRAASAENPVLLYLSGGPGQSDIGFARALLEPLTEDFVVVVWDQRGSGKSYPALEPAATFTLEQAVSDTIELVDHLRARFDEQKVFLLGESWGSTLGVLAVEQRPDLFHAYIGSGQMVSQRVTDQIIWRDLLAHAQATGNWELYDEILSLGEPPYADTPWAYSVVLGYYPLLETPYTPPASYIARGVASGVGMFGVGGREYSLIENANLLRGLLDMFSLMYPQLQGIDFRTDVPRLEVPVYVLDGEHELRGRRELAREWFEGLTAPSKQMVTLGDAGHAVAFEQVDAFRRLLVEEIVPATYGAGH
jgi:pimeloyl-ACP methyl ester carboxylesterase